LLKAADLINPTMGSCDEELIRENFWSVGVNIIVETLLAPMGMHDFVA
jgi:hypothetical protein